MTKPILRSDRKSGTMTLSRMLVSLCASALLLAGVAGADGAQLRGSVGPGFVISLSDGSGTPVTHLDPGTFSLTVDDKSNEHDFHLQGPGGVDAATEVDAVGEKTFSVALVDGKYAFFCDAHPTRMTGAFTVGTPPPEPPPAKPPLRVVLTVTTKTIGFATPAGTPVKALTVGPAVITVRDRSAARGVRLSGAGVSRTTGVRFVGTVIWKVKLSAGILVYRSDARKPVLRGGRVAVS